MQAPVETSAHQRRASVLERIRIDDIDYGRHYKGAIFLDSREQRLDPFLINFAMRVQKEEHLEKKTV